MHALHQRLHQQINSSSSPQSCRINRSSSSSTWACRHAKASGGSRRSGSSSSSCCARSTAAPAAAAALTATASSSRTTSSTTRSCRAHRQAASGIRGSSTTTDIPCRSSRVTPPAMAAADGAAPTTSGSSGAVPDLQSIAGILFDIDGTLTCSDPLHLAAFQEILVEEGFNKGVPIDEAFFRQHISGRHNPEIAADLFPEWPEERRVAFYTDKEARFRDMAASKLTRTAGLTELLAWAESRGLARAAVTNAPRDNAVMMLSALQLDGYFGGNLVLGEECPRAKPHPDPYLAALALLGLQAHQAIVVEDSPAGVRAAVAAGLPVFGIASGQDEAVLYEAGCCLVMDDFHALVALAQAHCGAAGGSSGGSDGRKQPCDGGGAVTEIRVTA